MSIDAMKQALSALYDIDATGVPVGHIDTVIDALRLAIEQAERQEPFVVKHYSGDERPIIKGNGFDGLEIGQDREEAQVFADWVNARLAPPQRQPLQVDKDGWYWVSESECISVDLIRTVEKLHGIGGGHE
jgi:hypothetical protein